MEMAKAIARDPRVVLVDEPFAGLTAAESEAFSELIRTFRAEGRAVLLVDYNVKSLAALANRAIDYLEGDKVDAPKLKETDARHHCVQSVEIE